jgi:archaeal flagellar protein FlaJ
MDLKKEGLIRFRNLKRNRMLTTQIIGVIIGFIIMFLSLIFIRNTNIFYFVVGLAFLIGGFPFFISIVIESKVAREKEEMFLELSRDLVESVKAGTPISKSILNIRHKDYGPLNPHIDKLANQISLGIPVKTALETFARDIDSNSIKRSVSIIRESEKAGGEIQDILDSVTKSVAQIEKLRKERIAAMYSLIVQGYIIFFIFIIIMLIMRYQILPMASSLGESLQGSDLGTPNTGGINSIVNTNQIMSAEDLAKPFLWLLILQGFFVGLVIGKLAEGKVKYGFKHSFILIVLVLLISTGIELFI